MEQVFAQARDAEAVFEEFLVDDAWKAIESEPEVEPVVEVHSNGANSNGYVVEPVLVSTNGNSHHDEPAEGQQSLFSWAEFLAEEPSQSQGRNGKRKPASTSLFEWALNAEQEQERERESELAGACR